MQDLHPTLTSSLSLPASTYIYKLLQSSPTELAIITSSDSLHFLDPQTLRSTRTIPNVHESITCLDNSNDPASNLILTAGRDGVVKYWDVRSKEKVLEIRNPHKLISTIHSSHSHNFLATGTENPDDGPSETPIYIYDPRSPSTPLLSLLDSHTDTITSLSLSHSSHKYLLSSSTDGLVSLFDTHQNNEEDALYQVINHRSAIASAGFVRGGSDVWALGTDETVAWYRVQSEREDVEEPSPRAWGDVREKFGCEYVVRLGGEGAWVAAGKHSEGWVDLIPVKKEEGEELGYGYEVERRIRLVGAHGEEIVRDVLLDEKSGVCYTCGEDGNVRTWKTGSGDGAGMEIDQDEDEGEKKGSGKEKKDRKEKRKEKKEKRRGEGGERYKPY